MFIHSVVPSKTTPDSRPKWAKSIPVSDQNGAKTLPDGAAHTYMAYIGEYPLPRGGGNYRQEELFNGCGSVFTHNLFINE